MAFAPAIGDGSRARMPVENTTSLRLVAGETEQGDEMDQVEATTTKKNHSKKQKKTVFETDSDPDNRMSFWGGPEPVPLPPRFERIKRNLIAGHEAAVEASWPRLIHALRAEVEHIEGLGPHLIPSIEFADVDDAAQTARFGRDLRRYGVGVVRKVLDPRTADEAVRDTVRYLHRRQSHVSRRSPSSSTARFRAPRQDPTCFDCFWTPAQVRCRAHPNVLRAQRFLMSLWDTGSDQRLNTNLPISYVDRVRVRGPGFDTAPPASESCSADASSFPASTSSPSSSPPPSSSSYPSSSVDSSPTVSSPSSVAANDAENASGRFWPPQPPPQQQLLAGQSADDWITALQSSAGVVAQVDNGSLERWEPDGYGRCGTYDRIFQGCWEQYDPWQCASRVAATIDLYNGYGSCSIFRMFQGLLALSTTEPGMLRLLPSPRLATAYYLLRPFFSPRRPAPNSPRPGPDWDAYLDPSNWELQSEPDTIIHGAVPGHAQRLTERWHPHLHLRSSLVTLPTLQPGDYIFWHPDLPYHFSNSDAASAAVATTPAAASSSPNPYPVSMLLYVPAAPLTQTNALYLARQRKAFRRGHPGPDFDTLGRGIVAEDPGLRPGDEEIARVGGVEALRAMGLAPWEPRGRPSAVVDLANLILFPE
ncbi:hypothetical protein L249_3050 [Ophiocordyceps polyrhachis-furcata BCC 54312]|uniref:DUF1479 domain protein n=1 Tax=Ophiocordyceps polyrhachis-furcata BCC 54312 TaxID=1330021 RepID=A0A367LR46_9HYPO|nr:hypothetical protein L249_3050 [Ophiocordyceps polyrhachis-furcata BCC 54312]